MLEHLKAQIGDKDTKDMTADELQFYYFNYGSKSSFFCDFYNFFDPVSRQHDYDNNNQLDGIELIQAMTHYERMDIEDRGGNDENYPRFSEQQFLDMGKFCYDFM